MSLFGEMKELEGQEIPFIGGPMDGKKTTELSLILNQGGALYSLKTEVVDGVRKAKYVYFKTRWSR
jgi:hypothetical protein